MGTLLEKAQRAEALKSQVLELYNELVPKRRSLQEIATLCGVTKARVHQIVKGRKDRPKGQISPHRAN